MTCKVVPMSDWYVTLSGHTHVTVVYPGNEFDTDHTQNQTQELKQITKNSPILSTVTYYTIKTQCWNRKL